MVLWTAVAIESGASGPCPQGVRRWMSSGDSSLAATATCSWESWVLEWRGKGTEIDLAMTLGPLHPLPRARRRCHAATSAASPPWRMAALIGWKYRTGGRDSLPCIACKRKGGAALASMELLPMGCRRQACVLTGDFIDING
ncbi:uncharacterized protein LOC133912910 [Phragmites australis]|uniref:uncharacterized protein LOC133912910 n=1 Tax=Phragmites australis TaxID=29695 RepID=UPI002D775E9A|nr:uncharacterized protein LOC133912910 [Phragmites australis]